MSAACTSCGSPSFDPHRGSLRCSDCGAAYRREEPSMPIPRPPAPVAAEGLRTSIDAVLRLVLERIDASRATPDVVADALHAAGVTVSPAWAADWIARTLFALANAQS